MTQTNRTASASMNGQQIPLPGAGDRLRGALHGAYRRERELPNDMLALLSALDQRTQHMR